jgi:hydroxymethylpyrimidine kinase/phosphomethylpyrimidine kinase
VLTIAGSDTGAGAGIQADLKTAAALGAFATSAITAVTAQNTHGVQAIFPLDPSAVEAQLRSVLGDIGADAIKVGMLANAPTAKRVAATLRELARGVPVVIDPVMVAKGGADLLDREARDVLVHELLPLASVVTPNADEAAVLTGESVEREADLVAAAHTIRALGAANVLVKGGHLATEDVADALARSDGSVVMFRSQRWASPSIHGTGCTLSMAIAVGLGRGLPVEVAVQNARDYLRRAVASAAEAEIGTGPNKPMKHWVRID